MFAETKQAVVAGTILSAVIAASAQAAPAVSGVSGTLSSGQTVTIAGSGFGTKSTVAPVLWDDFEKGNSGSLVQNNAAQIGKWDTGAGSEVVTYSTAKPRTGNKSAYHDFINNYNASLAKNMTFSRLYLDFWIAADYVDRVSRNFKPWRLYGANDSLQLDYVWLCDGQLMNRVQDSWVVGDWGGPKYSDGKWMHVQLVYQESTPGGSDGTIRHAIDSVTAGLNSGAVMTRKAAASFDQIRLGHYWDRAAVDACASNGGARVYIDDVYVDTSWARVELGNASTYATSTHREIQVPTAWSSGSVSVKFNPGTFAAGTTAYLYVTDSNNNTSPGIAVKIGDSATSAVTPNPPSSVSTQ